MHDEMGKSIDAVIGHADYIRTALLQPMPWQWASTFAFEASITQFTNHDY